MTAASTPVFVNGISFWSPRLPGWDIASAVLAGSSAAPPGSARRPAPSILPPVERRRAPDSVALAIEVAARACASAEVAAAELQSVFATAHGDLEITDYLCNVLIDSPLETSPTRFHNSVHNAAAGYWCIASGCHAPYTTISAADDTFGAGLLEALTQVAADEKTVLYVAYDIEARGPLATSIRSRGLLGAGLVLSPRRSTTTVVEVSWSAGPRQPDPVTPARPEHAELVGDNAMAPCLPFLTAVARGCGKVRVAIGPALALTLEIR